MNKVQPSPSSTQSAPIEPVTLQMSSLDLLFLLDEDQDLDTELGCESEFAAWQSAEPIPNEQDLRFG